LNDWLAGLDDGEMRHLAELARAGRVVPGTPAAVLRSYDAPSDWAEALQAFEGAGWTRAHFAEAVAAVAAARARTGEARASVVSTRPRIAGPDVVDTAVAVRRLFTQAQHEVLLAGFRVTERDMLEPLRRPAGRELSVRLFVDLDPGVDVLGRKQVPAMSESWPQLWWPAFIEQVWPLFMDAPAAWFAPSTLAPDGDGEWRSMHVKTVVVDRRWWFVTSANFTRRGHHRNLELGALIEDPGRAEEVVRCFDEWVAAGVFVGFPKSPSTAAIISGLDASASGCLPGAR